MWIRNTSRYPDSEVESLARLASRTIDMRNVCINVRNGALAGGAYNGVPDISNAPPAAQYLITLRLGTGSEQWPLGPVNYHFKAPAEVGPRNRFPFFVCRDWRDWLVKLTAHEARHIQQFRERAMCSEVECERFAVMVLGEFQRERASEPSEPREPSEPSTRPDGQISQRARRAGWGQLPASDRGPIGETRKARTQMALF